MQIPEWIPVFGRGFRAEARQAGVPSAQHRDLAQRLMRRESVVRRLVPELVVVIAVFAWLFGLNFLIDGRAIEDRLSSFAMALLYMGGAFFFGFACRAVVKQSILKRSLRRLIEEQLCFNCEYSLLGHEPKSGRIRCPECGTETKARV